MFYEQMIPLERISSQKFDCAKARIIGSWRGYSKGCGPVFCNRFECADARYLNMFKLAFLLDSFINYFFLISRSGSFMLLFLLYLYVIRIQNMLYFCELYRFEIL